MPRRLGITMRTYLSIQVMYRTGCNQFTAMEAVSSVAIEHPEWNLNERRTWQEWTDYQAQLEKGAKE